MNTNSFEPGQDKITRDLNDVEAHGFRGNVTEDDVEGHAIRSGRLVEDDDVEGHGFRGNLTEDEDTEGHATRGRGFVEDDDTEAHAIRSGRNVENQDDDGDDTEGHGVRVKI
jgi:hypothetical protein